VTAPKAERSRIYATWCERLEVIQHQLFLGFFHEKLWEEFRDEIQGRRPAADTTFIVSYTRLYVDAQMMLVRRLADTDEATSSLSARLVMHPFGRDDVDARHALWTDPDVRRYLWDDVVIPREPAAEVVEGTLGDWSEHGYGMWTVTMNRDLAGFAGFRSSEQGPELLFGFYPRYWHQGDRHRSGARGARLSLRHAAAAVRLGRHRSAKRSLGAGDGTRRMRFDRRGLLEGRDTLFFTTTRA